MNWFLYDNSLRHERVKVPLGQQFRIPYFTEKKVRIDNNENYAKMTLISKPISEDFNLKLKLWYNFTFLIL